MSFYVMCPSISCSMSSNPTSGPDRARNLRVEKRASSWRAFTMKPLVRDVENFLEIEGRPYMSLHVLKDGILCPFMSYIFLCPVPRPVVRPVVRTGQTLPG